MKKTSNPSPQNCDHEGVLAYPEQLHCEFGALIECDTAGDRGFGVAVRE